MDFKTHLQTSNLLLLTAIAVCAMMGLLTLIPGGFRVPARNAQTDGSANASSHRDEHPIVLSLPGPGPGPGSATDLGKRDFQQPTTGSGRQSTNSAPPAQQSRPRIGVRTHVMTVAAESNNDGTTVAAPRTATTEPTSGADGVIPEFTGFGSELPYVYVPVTVHPVTVNVDNKGLAAELAQIHQSLRELRDVRMSSNSATETGYLSQQQSSPDPEQLSAIRQRLDNLDQTIEQLREGSAVAEHYPEPEDSNSIIIAPFQSRRSQTMIRQALRPVPMMSAPSDSAAPPNWNSPLQSPGTVPFEHQVPSVPMESDVPAVPAVPADDSRESSGFPNALSLEGADFSEFVPASESLQPEQLTGPFEKLTTENEEQATPLNARPSTTVFQHTYRFSSPVASLPGGVQQTSMNRLIEGSAQPPSMSQPTTASAMVMRQPTVAAGQIKSPAGPMRSGADPRTRSSSGQAVRGADGKLRPAEQSGPTTFQKGLSYLKDRRWLPGFAASADSEDGDQSGSRAATAVESRTIHRATSALRFANRPAALQP